MQILAHLFKNELNFIDDQKEKKSTLSCGKDSGLIHFY